MIFATIIVKHQDKLPPGPAMAGYTPEAWKPIDSIMIYALVNFALSFNLHEEIAMLSVAQELRPENTAWLLPIYPDEPLPFDEAAKLKELDLKLAVESVSGLATLQSLLSSVGLSGVAASNNWAIGKDRTKGRASILCNDQHLFLSMPALYNMMHIRSGEFDVAGMNIAGIPCIIAGYNGHIAWGMTMVMADNQDIFLENLKLIGGRLYYLYKAIAAAFPRTQVQLCIVHMVRNSLRFVSWKDRKQVAADLKKIYQSVTVAEVEQELEAFAK